MRIKHFLDNWVLRLVFVPLVFLFACIKEDEPVSAPLTGAPAITVTTLLSNQGIIKGIDFLPNSNLLFKQKKKICLYDMTP
jgi:hypothetical protein